MKEEITCEHCGEIGKKERGEIARSRRLGRKMFCSQRCASYYFGALRKNKIVSLNCELCGVMFEAVDCARRRRFCSSSCASRGSMTAKRRNAMIESGRNHTSNLMSAADTLKKREAWKYVKVKDLLDRRGCDYEFEVEIGGRVFDLSIRNIDVLIEFDGTYHMKESQEKRDKEKNDIETDAGLKLFRIKTGDACVIDAFPVERLLDKMCV